MSRQRQHGRHAGAALMLLLATAATLFSGTTLAQTTDGNNEISYPNSTDLTVHYLDTVVISYETDYTTPWMYLFCEKNDLLQEIVYYSPSAITGNTNFSFELKFDYMSSTPCWFNLRPAQRDSIDNSTDVGASSPRFNYIADEGDHQTFAIDPNSIPATTTTKSTASPTSAAEPSSSDSNSNTSSSDSNSASNSNTDNSDNSDGGLSTGAKAGIAIGVIALVGLAAATAWLLFDRRRRQKASPVVSELDGGHDFGDGSGSGSASSPYGAKSITMSVSPPSATDNNTVYSPFSTINGAFSTIGSGMPPPPPPAAEKPGARQFHELPENIQRFELDGGGGGSVAHSQASMHSSTMNSPTMPSPASLESPTILHSPKVLISSLR